MQNGKANNSASRKQTKLDCFKILYRVGGKATVEKVVRKTLLTRSLHLLAALIPNETVIDLAFSEATN